MTEKKLHKQICTYLKMQYPEILFNTDMSGIKLTIGQAKQAKNLRSGNGFPDIMILYPKNQYSGLFLEVKKETPYKKDGNLKKNIHLKEQYDMLIKLNQLMYRAYFVWSFDMAKKIIDEYLQLK